MVMIANSEFFYIDLGELYSISSILVIVISLFIIISVHEFAHAVICRNYGGEVREIGFLLLYFQPCFYSDLSDAWLFKKKSHFQVGNRIRRHHQFKRIIIPKNVFSY